MKIYPEKILLSPGYKVDKFPYFVSGNEETLIKQVEEILINKFKISGFIEKERIENKKAIEEASSNLRNALKGTDIEEVKKITQDLVQASMKLGEAVYKSQQSAKSQNTTAKPEKNNEDKKNDNVVDADFEEVKEDKTKDKEKSA